MGCWFTTGKASPTRCSVGYLVSVMRYRGLNSRAPKARNRYFAFVYPVFALREHVGMRYQYLYMRHGKSPG